MADVRRVIEIDVKTSAQAVAAMRQIAQQTEAMEKRFTAVSTAARSFGSTLLGIFSVGAVIHAIRATAEAFDEMGKRAERVGVGIESLSALTYQARLANVGVETLDSALVKLSNNLVDMDTATNAGADALKQLGVTSKDPAKAMEEIAAGFAAMEDGAKKTALASDIFGTKLGSKLIPMLNEGAEGMQRAREEAEALGLIMTKDAAQAAQAFNDNMTRLSATIEGVRNRQLTPLIKALADVTNAFFGAGTAALSFSDKLALALNPKISHGEFAKKAVEIAKLEAELARVDERSAGEKLMQLQGNESRRAQLERRIALLKTEQEELTRLLGLRDRVNLAQQAEANRARAERELGDSEREKERQRREAERAEREAERRRREAERIEKERIEGFKKVGDEAEKAAKEISDAVAGFTSTTTIGAVEALNRQLEKLADLEADAAIRPEVAAQAREKLTRELLRQGDAHEKLAAEIADEADAAAALEARREALNAAVMEGALPIDAYLRKLAELDKAQSVLAVSTDKTKDEFFKLGEAIQRSIEGWASKATDAIVNFAHGVESSFSSMVNNVVGQFERMAVQILVMEPLFRQFAVMVRGLSIFGAGEPELLSNAQGAAFAQGGRLLPFARGGVVRSPQLFQFAGGTGLMGEAGPEAIMPLKRTPSGALGVEAQGAGGVTVNVINNAGADVSVEEGRSAATGERTITVAIERAVQDAFARGRFDSLMSATYGMNRRGR